MIISDISQGNGQQPLLNLIDIAHRRKAMLLVPVALGLFVGAWGYLTAPINYISEATLVLDMRRLQGMPGESALTPLTQDSPALRSELDLINSRVMAAKVIDILQADNVVAPTAPSSRTLLSTLFGQVRSASVDESLKPEERQRHQIDLLMSRLAVSNDGRSYTIFINYRDSDPVYAAKVANAFGTAYLNHQVEVQEGAARKVSDWLGEKLVTLQSDLEGAEKSAENFRQRYGLASEQGQITFQGQRVAGLNAEIIAATGAVSAAEARLRTAQSLISKGQSLAMAEVLASPAIQAMRTELARVERQLADLQAVGAIKSAEIPVLNAQRASLLKQIDGQVDEIVKSLQTEIDVAKERRENLQQALKVAEAELAKANQAQVSAGQLDREANASRAVYESYLTRYKQLIEQDGIALAQAQMISPAEPATAKSNPRLLNWILVGLGLGGFLAIAGTALLEAIDKIRYARATMRRVPGLPKAIIVPPAPQNSIAALATHGIELGTPFGKAIKMLYDRMRQLSKGQDSMAFSVASLGKGEGKSFILSAIAMKFAAAGASVAVIDASGDKRSLCDAFGMYADSDAPLYANRQLTGGTIVRDHMSGIDIVRPTTRQLDDEWLGVLIDELRRDHKIILVDLPSIREDRASILLSRATDAVLLVLRLDNYNPTRTNAIIQALSSFGRKPAIAVVNQLHPNYQAWLSGAVSRGRHTLGSFRRRIPARKPDGDEPKPNSLQEEIS